MLKAAHRVATAARGSAAEHERALLALAADDLFAGTLTAGSALERGRLLHGAVATAVEDVARARQPGRERHAALLWFGYVAKGETHEQLADRFCGDDPRLRTSGNVRYLMGLDRPGRTVTRRVYGDLTRRVDDALREVTAGPEAERGRAAVAAAWERVSKDRTALALLKHMSVLADAPLVLATLEGAGPLPVALAKARRSGAPRPAVAAAAALERHGLVSRTDVGGAAAAMLLPGVATAVRVRMPGAEAGRAQARMVGILDTLLPEDAVPPMGDAWGPAFPHVTAVCLALTDAADEELLLKRTGRLLRIASSYARLVLLDEQHAEELGLAAGLALSRARRGHDDEYAAMLVTVASATTDSKVSVDLTQAALADRVARLAPDDGSLLGTRLALANALAGDGRHDVARTTYEELTADLRQALLETLHDHAAYLLRRVLDGQALAGDLDTALALFEEARSMTRPGEHGHRECVIGWADALTLSGRAAEAEQPLRDLLAQTEATGDRRAEMEVRATLLQVTELTNAPDYHELDRRAWELDALIMGEDPRED